MTERAQTQRATLRAFALCVLTITLVARSAVADKVDDLIRDLNDSSDRVRITAVLALTNQESPRSIDALAATLGKKSELKNIRGLAASALGRIVQNGRPNAKEKENALKALRAAKGDSEAFVSAKASAALDQIGDTGGSSAKPSGPSAGIYVNVGSIDTKRPEDAQYKPLMQKSATSALAKVSGGLQTTWPGGVPTKTQLEQKNIAGFYIGGTLDALVIEKTGNSSKVSCKVNMFLASFPDKAVFGFLNGGASVQASASPREVTLASQDCVSAVVESLITNKIVPTIKSKAGS